ncbi:MAG TPA: hypothetical protein VH165_25055 [Kofleriaceae bacterium]|nr:hypothetical protein [Kofleriaceae bacterium]
MAVVRARRAVIVGLLAAAGLAGGAALGACGDDPSVIAPVIDVPIDDTDALATALDDITLTVAHAGSDSDLVSQSFARGAPIDVPGVPFGDDLVMHMEGFVGTSSVAYGRTCEIAVTQNVAPPTPHLFFSRSVKFASIGISSLARSGGLGVSYLGSAVLLGGTSTSSDGQGNPITVAVNPAERFDPTTGQLTTIGTLVARTRGAQALIGTPSRLVVMGGVSDGDHATLMEVLDGQTVEQVVYPGAPRADLTATALTDGRVLVIGGAAANVPSGQIDEVDENTDKSITVRTLDATLAHPRTLHTATRLSDELGAPVLIAGGLGSDGQPVRVAELFKPLTDELASPPFAPMLVVPRSGHLAARLPDDSVLIIGGVDATGMPVTTLERFTIDAGFVEVGTLPADAGVINFAAATLPDGRILITGGSSTVGGATLNTAYIIRLDPLDGQIDVVATDHLASARAGHQMAVLCDGTVIVSGGTLTPSKIERYNPPPAGRR